MKEDLAYLLALTQVEGIGHRKARALVGHFGSARHVLEADPLELIEVDQINEKLAKAIVDQDLSRAQQELQWCDRQGVQVITLWDEDYPYRLKNIPDPPVYLFGRGEPILNHRRMIGIVGTRSATDRGKETLRQWMQDLQRLDPIIVSGLAYGVDIAAHRFSLELDIPNISVIGSGLSRIYPQAHHSTALKIEKTGMVVTEFWHDLGPEREHFPMRNRILAGLCDVLIVVESKKKGGSMITANLANGYNRDVFALPGRPEDEMSEGCNLLIKSHQAHMMESVQDLKYITQWSEKEMSNTQGVQTRLFVELNDTERKIVESFGAQKELSLERLSITCGIPISQLTSTLLGLEIKGMVRSLPGNRYIYIH